MCGIFGFRNLQAPATEPEFILERMAQAVFHRGPDEGGFFHDASVGLGNRRLAIIDLAHGKQPFSSADGQIVVVQNGEIFNFVELNDELKRKGVHLQTQSDTETILRLYETYGDEFVHKLNGMFAIAIYDQRDGELRLYRDRLGEKPLYFYFDGSHFSFGSEIKALFSDSRVKKRVDPQAMSLYLTLGYLPAPYTLFENIQQVRPGHLMRVSRSGLKQECWWDPELTPFGGEESDYVAMIQRDFLDAVRIRMRADVPFGAFLSGGIDSSWTVSQMAQLQNHGTKTFTVSFGGTSFDEWGQASSIAKKYGLETHSVNFDSSGLKLWPRFIYHCDLPHADVSFLPTYTLSQLAQGHVKMVLTGDGADELFAGYGRYLQMESQFQGRGDPGHLANIYLNSSSVFQAEALKQILRPEVRERTLAPEKIIAEILENLPGEDRLNKMLYLDLKLLLPGNNLVKPDRMGMAVSLEARPPFMDYRLAEMALRMESRLKIKEATTKNLVKKASVGELGPEVVYRSKQMFSVPVTEWFAQGLADLADRILVKERRNPYLEDDAIGRLIGEHRLSPKTGLKELRALISLELWYRLFVDEEPLTQVEQSFGAF